MPLTKTQKRQKRQKRRDHYKSQIKARTEKKRLNAALTIQKCFRKYQRQSSAARVIQIWFRDLEHIKQYYICTKGFDKIKHTYSEINNDDLDWDDNFVYLKHIPPIALAAVFYDFPKIIPRLFNEYRSFPHDHLQQLLFSAISHDRLECVRVILDLGANVNINKYNTEYFNYRHIKYEWYEMNRVYYSDEDDYDYDREIPYFSNKNKCPKYANQFEIIPPLFMSKSVEMTKLLLKCGADPLVYQLTFDKDAKLPYSSDKTIYKLVHDRYRYNYANRKIPRDKFDKYLVKAKKDITYIKGAFVETDITAIHYAIRMIRPDIVMVLMDHISKLESIDKHFGTDISRIIRGYMNSRSSIDFKRKFNIGPIRQALSLNFNSMSKKVFINPRTGFTCRWEKLVNSNYYQDKNLKIYPECNIEHYEYCRKYYSHKEYRELPYDYKTQYDTEKRQYYKNIGAIISNLFDYRNGSIDPIANMNSYDRSWLIHSYAPSSNYLLMNMDKDIIYEETSDSITISHEGAWSDFKEKWRNKGVCIESIKNIFGRYELFRENKLNSVQSALEEFFE